jgi:hypothetical protein
VKFLRHLAAVVLTVAVIVGLGMLWAHASGSSTGSGSELRRPAPGQVVLRIKGGVIRGDSDDGFHLANTGNLIQTVEIEAALAAVVITASAIRRQHRRKRRGTARA